MPVKTSKASTPIMFALVGGLGLGVAYGVVRSFHLGLVAQICSLLALSAILWLIYRQGKAGAYANAQAWAQAQVDVAIEVTNQAQAKAQALSEAYSLAIAQAQATAQNAVTLNVGQNCSVVPVLSQENDFSGKEPHKLENPLILPDYLFSQEATTTHERFDVHSPQVAMGEQFEEESQALRSSTDS